MKIYVYMGSKIINLNESQLKCIVKESVKRVLREMAEAEDDVTSLAMRLQEVMRECGRYYTRKNEIPIDELGLKAKSKSFGTMHFDTLKVGKSEPYLYDYEYYMTSKYGPYGEFPQDGFEYDECGNREGVGLPLSKLDPSYTDRVVEFLKTKIDEYTTKIPEYKKQEEDNRRWAEKRKECDTAQQNWLKSLPFMQRYYYQQYGKDEFEKAFKQKVPNFYEGLY